ncbi:L-threonylcarbamoyladenylate synthase [Chlamydia avium]|uniref:L-threonylcarbamoyladenylate synthase n=1 Tax=Chlamydia avium TaxID=1457141 RepID=A0ABP2X6F7_9CHLA|nr:L-threonylcarbamoyladenylate synthase [Chlamydia avium]EPP35879.1 telomere recombination family protein [Chlamydia psittaci 10_743_SC13]EPP38428.1 telomere recombination family protein [Chlamydia avium]
MSISIQDLFIKNALEFLKKGKVIAFPTDTVYGLGVTLNFPGAESQIYTLKQRDPRKPLVVYVNELEDIEKVSGLALSAQEKILAEKFFPGPITLLVNHANPQFLQKYLGFRIISSPVLKKLIQDAGPLLGTSANISNFPPAIVSDEVLEDFSDKDIYVIPGQCDYGLESTVISADPLKIYREGIISKKTISNVIPGVIDCVCTQRSFDNYVKIYTVKSQSHLNEFLEFHPDFQGIICHYPRPRDFYPTLRKALRAIKSEVIFLYDSHTSMYPELSSYLTPYTFNPIKL